MVGWEVVINLPLGRGEVMEEEEEEVVTGGVVEVVMSQTDFPPKWRGFHPLTMVDERVTFPCQMREGALLTENDVSRSCQCQPGY